MIEAILWAAQTECLPHVMPPTQSGNTPVGNALYNVECRLFRGMCVLCLQHGAATAQSHPQSSNLIKPEDLASASTEC